MAFQVFTGAFRELEAALVDELRRKQPLEPALVIARSHRIIRRHQIRLADPVAVNVHWCSLEQASERLAAEQDDDRRVVGDDLVLEKLVLELIREYFGSTVYLSRAVRSHKTASALLQALRDLKQADLPFEQLPALLSAPGLVEKDRLSEIFRLLELYEKALDVHKIHDRDDLLRISSRRAKDSPWLAGMKRIYLYGFYDFNQLQWNLVDQIARAHDTRLYFPLAPGPAAEFPRRFFTRYVQPLCGRLQAPVRNLDAPGPRFEDRLFSEDLSPQPAPLRIVNASGRHDEVWFAAKHIAGLLQRGVPPREIAVVARSLEEYADIIAGLFRDNRIPHTLSAPESIRSWPIVQTIETLVDLPSLDYERSAVIQVLSSGFFIKPAGSDPTLWNLATSLLGIGRGEKTWLDRLDAAIERGGVRRDAEDEESEIRVPADQLQLLRESFTALSRSLKRFPARASWSAFIEATVAVLQARLADADRVVEIVRDLEGLESVWLGRPVDRAEFVETLVEKLERSRVPGPRNFPGVMVMDAMAARGLSFRHVYLLGVNEKIFPRFVSEEPFVNDRNRVLIGATLGAKLDTKKEAYEHERWLYALALGGATEEITLSYRRANDEGRVLAPSIFLREAAYRLPQAQGLTFDEFVAAHVTACHRTRMADFEPMDLLTPSELFLRVEDETAFEQLGGDPEMIRRALAAVRSSETSEFLGPRDGIVGPPFQAFWSSYSGRVSPTFLEQYAVCPMRCLLGRVLALTPFERPEEIEQATPLDLGNLAHETLAAFYTEWDGRDPETALQRVWNRVSAKFDGRAVPRYPLLWTIQKGRLFSALRKFLLDYDLPQWEKTPLVSRRCEIEPENPIAIPGIDGVKFRGTLDRLFELSDGTVRVDDYKWKLKGAGSSATAALRGRALQLAFYTRLAASIVPGAKKIRANLILLRRILEPASLQQELGEEPIELFEELPEDFWSEQGPRFAANVSALVALLSKGMFFINPETGRDGGCTNCDFATACRKSHYPTAQRPREDPDAQPYWGVREAR